MEIWLKGGWKVTSHQWSKLNMRGENQILWKCRQQLFQSQQKFWGNPHMAGIEKLWQLEVPFLDQCVNYHGQLTSLLSQGCFYSWQEVLLNKRNCAAWKPAKHLMICMVKCMMLGEQRREKSLDAPKFWIENWTTWKHRWCFHHF